MPLEQDVNEAIFRLHIGTTLPFWDMAVKVQYNRLAPIQNWVITRIAAAKRIQTGCGGTGDEVAAKELDDLLEERFLNGNGASCYSHENRADAMFLLIAVRTLLTMADRIVDQLKPLRKEAEAATARNAFTSKYGMITHLRDVTLHYDAYAVGGGKHQHLIRDHNEFLGVGEDEAGRLIVFWGGNRVNLLDAANAAITMSRELTRMFWIPLTTAATPAADQLEA